MTTWIDGPRWDAERAAKLTQLFWQSYNTEELIWATTDRVGLDRGAMPLGHTVGARWIDLVRALHDARLLRRAAELLSEEFPVYAAQVADLAQDPPAAADYNPVDVYAVHLLAGRRPLLDRGPLRDSLRVFLDDPDISLFVIRGKPRTGKTFSLELLQHVTRFKSDFLVVDVDFAPVANGDDAAALIAKLCDALDIDVVRPEDDATTGTRQAIALVDRFVGRYKRQLTDGRHRLLVIDGLNRSDLQKDVETAAAYLAVQIIAQRLPRTKLVLTGYSGPLDPDHEDRLCTEEVTPPTETHVRTYFQDLSRSAAKPLDDMRLTNMVIRAFTGDTDVRSLGRRVRELTLEFLEKP